MHRDLLLPAVAALVAVGAIVAYGNYRRCRRRAADVSENSRQPLQTWEYEGGALPDAGASASPAPGV
jgi:hypothetical protein